ncbi:MAG: FkbM family methyltransferase [Ignavibacteriota bacterium]|jgi:FkbM family methyltransferase|nr:MAG: FkbM family methyltransferase [Chlorobiota bacterium]MBE7475179.1 FkbM family methyltransferase [Ignavibacteriales bacterium]MBL1122145.1 FkbM family methyltransferase [Ignavibacteriota bacterium]MCC7095283.1 FkbM family methyltransferase [Ignavibacteriaceae bacterium]MCE7856184.1 FkbM family methyltransferase [Ignavibacteria bacterium CHB3]MEB2296650.1 FkbM family methyltransferase [Ignavibacteria bacterium]
MKRLKNILPEKLYLYLLDIYNNVFNDFTSKAYAQEGEDLILSRLFYGKIVRGFYIDVGAHHPKRFSNTYYFYKRGWRGINIEPMPGSKNKFDRIRPKDINLEIPISSKEEELTYYIFNEPALNGFSRELSSEGEKLNAYKIVKTVEMKTKTLGSVLDTFLPKGQNIDFMSIDVEGLDSEVLKSNNWDKYVPMYIIIEDKEFSFENPQKSEVYCFLNDQNYQLLAKTLSTLIFRLK